jgi:cytochrome c553
VKGAMRALSRLARPVGSRVRVLCGAVTLGWLSALASAQTMPSAPPPSADVQEVLELRGEATRGRAAYQPCVPCHRADGSGRAAVPIPRLAGQHARVVVKQVVDIRSGRRLNPAMKELLDDRPLGDQTLADIAAFLEGLPVNSASVVRGTGSALERGKALYDKDCAECHGSSGEGRAQTLQPMVAAQHYAYLQRELRLIAKGERGNSDATMAARLKAYAAADLDAVADHMSRLPAPPR